MLIDKNIKIKHKNQFISKVYCQNKIIYESTVDITVDITVKVYLPPDGSYAQILFKIDGNTIHSYMPRYDGDKRTTSFNDVYQVERGSIVSFEWARVPSGHEATWDHSFDPSGTVVTESRFFSVGIKKANTGGDIM